MTGGVAATHQGVSLLVPMTQNRCYTIVGAGGPGVAEVDLFLFDIGGRKAAVERSRGPTARIDHCIPFTGNYRVELKVKRGGGEVAFQVFEAPLNAPPPGRAPPPPLLPPRLFPTRAELPMTVQLVSVVVAPAALPLPSPVETPPPWPAWRNSCRAAQ